MPRQDYDPALDKVAKSFGPVVKGEHSELFVEVYSYNNRPNRVRIMERGTTTSGKSFTSNRMKGLEPGTLEVVMPLLQKALDFCRKGGKS